MGAGARGIRKRAGGMQAGVFVLRGERVRLRVKSVMQKTDYTCGPASLRAVLSYFGISAGEMAIAGKAHTTSDAGTSHAGMVAAARAYGMRTESMYDSGVTDIEMHIDRGMPVIVNFILSEDEETGAPEEQGLRYGHYSVVTGYDGSSLFIMDVDIGMERVIGKSDFESVWFSERYGRRWLLVLYPKRPRGKKAKRAESD